jgi:hypothetical protein
MIKGLSHIILQSMAKILFLDKNEAGANAHLLKMRQGDQLLGRGVFFSEGTNKTSSGARVE